MTDTRIMIPSPEMISHKRIEWGILMRNKRALINEISIMHQYLTNFLNLKISVPLRVLEVRHHHHQYTGAGIVVLTLAQHLL
jgi:hypothetical protein